MSSLHTTEYYSAFKRGEILTRATTWMNLEDFTQGRGMGNECSMGTEFQLCRWMVVMAAQQCECP